MKNKIILTIIMGILFLSLASAANCGSNDLGTFKQGEQINLRQTCDTCTYVTLSSVTIPPNATMLYFDSAMTKQGIEYNYSFFNTSNAGDYFYVVYGDKDGVLATETFCFEITQSGDNLTTAGSFLYIGLLALLIVLFLFDISGISQLPNGNEKDEYGEIMSINNLKYLKGTLIVVGYALLIAIFFIASNVALAYLNANLLGNVLFKIYQILMILAIPFMVLWVILLLVNIFKDKEVRKMIDRGVM